MLLSILQFIGVKLSCLCYKISDLIPVWIKCHWEYKKYCFELMSDEEWLEIEEEEELPFIQLWPLNDNESLALKQIIRTPDLTAVVYVIGEDSYTKDFKRRIYEGSYIKVDGKKFYLKNKNNARATH